MKYHVYHKSQQAEHFDILSRTSNLKGKRQNLTISANGSTMSATVGKLIYIQGEQFLPQKHTYHLT